MEESMEEEKDDADMLNESFRGPYLAVYRWLIYN